MNNNNTNDVLGAAYVPPRTIFPVAPAPGTDPLNLPASAQPGSAGNGVLRPSGTYIHPDCQLMLTAFNIATGLKLRVSGIMQRANGELSRFQQDFSIAATGAEVDNAFFVGEGYLQSIYVSVIAGSPGYGDVYVEVGILYGTIIDRKLQVGLLLAGYVTATRTLSNISSNTSQFGAPSVLQGSGGFPFDLTIPAGTQIILKAISALVVTDANVGNRYFEVQVKASGAGTTYLHIFSSAPMVASTTYNIQAYAGATDSLAAIVGATAAYIKISMPEMHLVGGNIFHVEMIDRKAGDAVSNINVEYDSYSL